MISQEMTFIVASHLTWQFGKELSISLLMKLHRVCSTNSYLDTC